MKVALVGNSVSNRHLAPYDDPSWEVWTLGTGLQHAWRCDRYFEIHEPAFYPRKALDQTYGYPAASGASHIYRHPNLEDKFHRGDGSIIVDVFPFPEVEEWAQRPYFTSSIEWMAAFALMRFAGEQIDGVFNTDRLTELGLWGVDMTYSEEYRNQKAALEWVLGIAQGMGIKVTIGPGSPILECPFRYALDDKRNAAMHSALEVERGVIRAELGGWNEKLETARNGRVQMMARRDELAQLASLGMPMERLSPRLNAIEAELKEWEKQKFQAEVAIAGMGSRLDTLNMVTVTRTYPPEGPRPRATRILDYPDAFLRIHVDNEFEQSLRVRSVEKEPETAAWLRGMGEGDVLWDVGACIGAYSLIAASRGARAVAFEPSALNFIRLSENVRLNRLEGKVITLPVALSGISGVDIFHHRDAEPGAANHFMGVEPPFVSRLTHSVLALRGEDAMAFIPPPTHLKIDVDGGELDVIRGAEGLLAYDGLRSVLVEVDETHGPRNDVIELVRAAGFDEPTRHNHNGGPISNLIFDRAPILAVAR